jgi:AAA domain
MPLSTAQREPTLEYLNCVEREEAMARLRDQAGIQKFLLVFGPEGVGKSRLLQRFAASQPLALYIAQMRSPREFVLALFHALHAAEGEIKVSGNLGALSTSSMKGIVHRFLDHHRYLMVLDHL